jgi:monothiol glutaredoxin
LENHNLPCEDRDIINNPFNYTEILEKSGQSLSPCVEVNGHMPADVNGDEVEAYLLESRRAALTSAVADAPANWACDAHHHE